MDRVFSVDDISGQFWSPPPPPPSNHHQADGGHSAPSSLGMNRSESEWAFQRFLLEANAAEGDEVEEEEDVVEINDPPCRKDEPGTRNGDEVGKAGKPEGDLMGNGKVPVDAEEYQAFLKSKLNLACAAVALSRASFVRQRDSSSLDCPQSTKSSMTGSQALSKGHRPSRSLDKEVPTLSAIQKTPAVPVKSGTSGSSRDQSDDDETVETAATESMDPADAKRVKRMLSNRESARRSRRRKQAHLTELETKVAQLRVENSSLQRRLGDVNKKYNEAAVDNRVLKADVETLRAKVKMAEETVKRLTGLNLMFHTMPEISPASMPSFEGSPLDTSADAAVPVRDDDEPKNQSYQFNPTKPLPSAAANTAQRSITSGVSTGKMARPRSMQRVASLEHLQKRIRGDSDPSGPECDGSGRQAAVAK
ncbi:hypothetical protein MLD38_023681 [Melastoma candidum]|uniref:Uncharacterized protein n=1 Tax=Melastoma candidum TaxID=119954 RepID=A0ACB9NTB9_9MYRT|nr:hypothetical protein MLD38_023681 [Melastoma candidum]